MLAASLEFVPAQDAKIFAAAPASAAVFVLRSDDPAAEPYVTKTANLRRRLQRLLSAPEAQSKKLNLRDRVRCIEYSSTGSDFESGFLLYQVLRSAFPHTYSSRLRLRFAPLVKLHLQNQYPRASITTRLGRGQSLYYGPFFSRTAAEKFANDSLDFFKMRRCVDDLHPDPAFPGCIYSEMKMCLAPCFKGCSDEAYKQEVERVQTYFDSNGESLAREISTMRDQASANLEFEAAAAEHARLEKLRPVLSQLPEVVHRIDRLVGVLVQPGAAPGAVNLFRIDGGCLAGPVTFLIQPAEHAKSQSMEGRILEAMSAFAPAAVSSNLEAMEHLALLRRWYYRGTRVGEIFFGDEKGNLPMRRLVRGIARVYRGEKVEEVAEAVSSVPPAQRVQE